MIELLKFIVQPVVIERDADGNIIGERIGEAMALYNVEAVNQFVETVMQQINVQGIDVQQ